MPNATIWRCLTCKRSRGTVVGPTLATEAAWSTVPAERTRRYAASRRN